LNRDDDNTTTCSWGRTTTGAAMEATTEAGDNATTARHDDRESNIGDVGGLVQGHDALPGRDEIQIASASL
jgi:hypothetical protein